MEFRRWSTNITKDDKQAKLTFLIHGMEPELPTDISQLGDVLPDPRYPDWETQIEHHKEINKASRRARETYWGCGDKSVVMYFIEMSDSIGAHLERTGRKFWTQAGKYSHSYCEHILQDPWCHNLEVFLAEKDRLSTGADSQSSAKHYHLFDKHNMSRIKQILDKLNETEETYEGPIMIDPKSQIPIRPVIKLST